jgi:dolichyl-diphosphooligosaccharide--protein glycosyltransferase
MNKINKLWDNHSLLFEITGFILLLAVGLLVRVEDIADWKSHPENAMYRGEPLLTTFDGYYYLGLARDIKNNTYNEVHEKRAVPESIKRPSPPPLISVIAAAASQLTGFSLNRVGAFLPAILGLLLAIPLYAFGRYYGGPVMGFTAALTGLLSHYYVYRSSLGWFDTDCMNVTWATGAAYCFMRFGLDKGRRRYIFLAAGAAIYVLFLWWWDQTPLIATTVSFVPLAVAIAFFYRPSRREGLIFISLAAAVMLGVLAWKGIDLPIKIINEIGAKFSYISKDTQGPFPNIGVTISEQARPTFAEIVAKTTDSFPVFFLAAAGLAILFYKKPRESMFLSVPLLLACLSFLFAKRFLIFLAPITAIGTGYVAAYLWQLKKKHWAMMIITAIFIAIISLPAFQKDMEKTFWPKEPPFLVHGMVMAGEKTPENAVLWAWWDHGYPMIYFANRATINDGAIHSAERSVYNAIPYTTDNMRYAANFMQFYTVHGMAGMDRIYRALGNDHEKGMAMVRKALGAGPEAAKDIVSRAGLEPDGDLKTPEQWISFLFPDQGPPVYLFVDWRLTLTSHWWFWLGSWDIPKHDGIHPLYKPFYNMKFEDMEAKNDMGVSFSFRNGELHIQNRKAMINRAILNDGMIVRTFQYDSNSNRQNRTLSFEMFKPSGFAAVEDQHISKSVFNRLFIRHQPDKRYFTPVAVNTPAFQIWRVNGEHAGHAGQ